MGWERYSLTQFIKGPQLVESLKLQHPQYHLKANALSLSLSLSLSHCSSFLGQKSTPIFPISFP